MDQGLENAKAVEELSTVIRRLTQIADSMQIRISELEERLTKLIIKMEDKC